MAQLLRLLWLSSSLTFGFLLGLSKGQELENKVLVCYWGTWSHYRNDSAHFSVDKIPPTLCTHLVYSFFGLDPVTNTAISLDPWLDYSDGGGLDMIRKTVALKLSNPKLMVTLAIGGWNEGSEKYSIMARSQETRATFIASIIDILRRYGLDGVDLDWEYPARRGGIPEDKGNFVLLLKELREALDASSRPPPQKPFILTSAFGCYEKYLDVSYDIPEIAKYLDYFHLMLYDFKMYDDTDEAEPGSKLIGHHAPLFSKDWEDEGNKTMTTSYAVESFIRKGAPANKLVFGVGTYGKTYKLFRRELHNFYDEAMGSGTQSNITVAPGTSAMFEICWELLDSRHQWEMGFDNDYKIPYAYSDTKWIGYDDTLSARLKTDYAMTKGLAGMMVWSLDFDDFGNHCEWREFPIINSLKDRLIYYDRMLKNET